MFNVNERTIFLAIHGSHSYGLNTPESDLDLRGVCVEPIEYIVGFLNNFEQAENVKFSGYEQSNDCTIFGLKKFIKLCCSSNPNALEILFVNPEHVIKTTSWGNALIEYRNEFLSKRAKSSFAGYCKGQFNRMENHRQWIINTPKPPPTREEFGLPLMPVIPNDQLKAAFAAIEKKLDQWNFKDMSHIEREGRIDFINAMAEVLCEMKMGSDELWKSAGVVLGYDTNFLQMLDKERTYNNLNIQYKHYQDWLKNRNKKRFELEQKCLIDVKHACQLIRLYMSILDILSGKEFVLKRNSEETELLLAIKTGKFGKDTYKIVVDLKNQYDIKVEQAFLTTKLPDNPDMEFIDILTRKLYISYWETHEKGTLSDYFGNFA